MKISDLEKRLRQVRRCQTVGITAIVTPSRMRKTNNPNAGKVRKVTIGRGMINVIHDAAVNRQRIREGLPANFKSDEPFVGPRVPGCPLCERENHNDGSKTVYLEIWVQRLASHFFHTDDGRELSYFEDVRPFEYQKPNTRQQPSFSNSQGTRKAVRSLTYRLDSIAELRLGGESWRVEPLAHELERYIIPAQTSADDAQHQCQEAASP